MTTVQFCSGPIWLVFCFISCGIGLDSFLLVLAWCDPIRILMPQLDFLTYLPLIIGVFSTLFFAVTMTFIVMIKLHSILLGVKIKVKLLGRVLIVMLANVSAPAYSFGKAAIEGGNRGLCSTNHKNIAILYFIFGAFSGVIGTILSVVIRL